MPSKELMLRLLAHTCMLSLVQIYSAFDRSLETAVLVAGLGTTIVSTYFAQINHMR